MPVTVAEARSVLSEEQLDGVADLLPAGRRAALLQPEAEPLEAMLAVGQLLRAGGLVGRGTRLSAGAWAEHPPPAAIEQAESAAKTAGQQVLSQLERFVAEDDLAARMVGRTDAPARDRRPALEPSWLAELVELRDDVESLAVALGVAALAADDGSAAQRAERAARDAVVEGDRLANAVVDALHASALASGSSFSPWLHEIAPTRLDSWWLRVTLAQAVSRALGRVRLVADAAAAPAPSVRRPIRLPRPTVALHMGAPDSVFTKPVGPLLARLHDGDVEIYAIASEGALVDGLVVRHRDDAEVARLRRVELRPSGPSALYSEVALRWWLPLASAAARVTVVVALERGGRVVEDEIAIELG